MERRSLGNRGLGVSVIWMGTWRAFDVRGQQAEAHAALIVDRVLAAGTDFFGSSPLYDAAGRVPVAARPASSHDPGDQSVGAQPTGSAGPDRGEPRLFRRPRRFVSDS